MAADIKILIKKLTGYNSDYLNELAAHYKVPTKKSPRKVIINGIAVEMIKCNDY